MGLHRFSFLVLTLALLAGCPTPASPPSPPSELPTNLTLPGSISVDISETLPPPAVTPAALKTIELGGEFSDEITATSEAAQNLFDQIDSVLSRFGGLVIPANESPNQTLSFPGGEAFIDFGDFDIHGTGGTAGCSGHSAATPMCVRLWVKGPDGFQRVLSAVFDFPPSAENKGKGEIRFVLEGGCYAAVRYDFLIPDVFQSSETFYGCPTDGTEGPVLGPESKHAFVTFDSLDRGWLKIVNAAGYTDASDTASAFQGINTWENDSDALLGVFQKELFCANLFTGNSLGTGNPQCLAVQNDAHPEGIEPSAFAAAGDILPFDFPETPPFLCSGVSVDDGDVCTTDACDPQTGIVSHTPVGIDDGNACTEDTCNPHSGPAHQPVAIDDGSVCTIDSCDPQTGKISHASVSIDDGNACTLDSCDPVTGVHHTPVTTDDADACTIDTCNPADGVISHAPVSVDDGNACTVDACDSSTGEVTHQPVGVDDQNPCTADACDPATGGVSHTLLDADGDGICDALDPCPNDTANDSDGDGLCDSQDPCPLDPANDVDRDGVCGNADNCPLVSNADQTDTNADGVGDACVPLTDCHVCVDSITWSGPAPKEQAMNQCQDLVDFDALSQNMESDCLAKCNALENNSKNHAVSGGQCVDDFCAAVSYQLNHNLICQP